MSNKYFLIDRMFSQHDRYLLKKLLDKVNEVDAEGEESEIDIETLTSIVQGLVDNPATEQLGIDLVNGSTTKYLSEKGTMEEVPEPAVTQLGIDLENGSTTKYLSEKGTMEEVPDAPAPLTNITYEQLAAAIAASTLTPGAKYLITDYQTVHTIPETSDTNTGEVEPLLVTAISANELAPEAYSALFPDDVIYYSPTNDQAMVPGCTKGYIYRRVDTKQNNDIPFDFRQVKFRRWQISQPTWDAATTYTKGAVVKSTTDDTLWMSLQDNNLNNTPSDTADWRQFEWDNLSYVSPSENNWYIVNDNIQIIVTCTALYQDYKIWANAADYTSAFSNKIDTPLISIIGNTNTVIFGADFYGNSVGANFSNNSIGANFNSNSVGAYFSNNSIGTGFSYNSIGANFRNNSIGAYFYGNSVGADFYNNSIGADFNNNSVGVYFGGNFIEGSFVNNSIGADFHHNSIGAYFYKNFIVARFYDNSIGTNFYENSIGDNFSYNSVGTYFYNNSIGANFNSNSVGAYFSNNSIGTGFSYNSVGANFSYNLASNIGNKDLLSVTELYNKYYPHEIISAVSGYVITWYDATGTQQKTYTA